jgi:hypothetical protein
VAIIVAVTAGLAADYPHHPVNLSLFRPLSTNRNPDISTNFRLNLIYGRVGSVKGVDLSGVVGPVAGDVVGFQASGVYSHVGGKFTGAAVTGIASYVRSDLVGVQFAGLVNFVQGDLLGFQFADLFNYVEGDVLGFQATPLFNLVDGDVKYVQFATIVNAIAGDFTGAQISTGLNYVNETVTGAQAGLFGFAKEVRGVQISAGNVAGRTSGVQIGVVNYAKRSEGLAIGMVNVAGNGEADWVTFASNLAAVNTGIRTSRRGFYSMLTVGVADLKAKRNDTGFLSWHYGHAFPVGGGWSLDADVGFVHIIPSSSADPAVNTKSHFAVQARLLAEFRVSEKARLFAGGGVSGVFSEYSSSAESETDPLVVAGLSLF